jgi:hypothetical protein
LSHGVRAQAHGVTIDAGARTTDDAADDDAADDAAGARTTD